MGDPVVSERDFGRLEQQVATLTDRVKELSEMVHELTAVLQQTKGGWKLIMFVVGVAGALSAVISWLVTNANFK